jgi:hypothetical protein
MRQREKVKLYRRNRGMERVAQKLIARQLRKLKSGQLPASLWKTVTPNETVKQLGSMSPEALGSINVIFIKAPVPILALSEQIAEQLNLRAEASRCDQKYCQSE